jgi:hypothetical protein
VVLILGIIGRLNGYVVCVSFTTNVLWRVQASELQCYVVLKKPNISEEHIACIFHV